VIGHKYFVLPDAVDLFRVRFEILWVHDPLGAWVAYTVYVIPASCRLETEAMFESLKNILTGQSDFAFGGLLLMIIGGLTVYLRTIPERLWHWIVSQTTMMITVKDDDAAFTWVKEWFLEQEFLKQIRQVDLDTTLRSERIAMIPAPGKHWFWYGGRPFEVWFSRTENTHERTGRRTESLTFRTPGRKRALLQDLVDDIVEAHIRRQGTRSYLYTYNDGWNYMEGYSARLLEIGCAGTGRKGTPGARYCPVPEIETTVQPPGNPLPPRLLVLWAAWHREDFSDGRAGRALRTVDLRNQSDGLQ